MKKLEPPQGLEGRLRRHALFSLPLAGLYLYWGMKRVFEGGFSIENTFAPLLAAPVVLWILLYPYIDLYRPSPSPAEHVERVPGSGLRRFAQLCFSKKVYGRVFEQILSDLLMEYFEALAEGDWVKARCVLVRGYGAFWLAFVAQLPVSLAKVVVELWIASK